MIFVFVNQNLQNLHPGWSIILYAFCKPIKKPEGTSNSSFTSWYVCLKLFYRYKWILSCILIIWHSLSTYFWIIEHSAISPTWLFMSLFWISSSTVITTFTTIFKYINFANPTVSVCLPFWADSIVLSWHLKLSKILSITQSSYLTPSKALSIFFLWKMMGWCYLTSKVLLGYLSSLFRLLLKILINMPNPKIIWQFNKSIVAFASIGFHFNGSNWKKSPNNKMKSPWNTSESLHKNISFNFAWTL